MRRLGGRPGIRHGKFHRELLARSFPGKGFDASAETILDPLQDKAIGRDQAQPARRIGAG